jgi:pseudouridine-5'-phosphate glycosidase
MTPVNPNEAMRLWMQMGLMAYEAQVTITLRMLGMAGLWHTAPGENQRMMQEKTEAMQQSAIAATQAVLRGKSSVGIAQAALNPVRKRTQANAKRLTARGPKIPKM